MLSMQQSCCRRGLVPGGGVALIQAAAALEKEKFDQDEHIGLEIIRRACENFTSE